MSRFYKTHGDTGTRLYRIWKTMKCRCMNPNHPTFRHYGARGIEVCEGWREDYPSFKEWATANGYGEGLELDRIDVNGNYEPSNCRWITHRDQSLNRRDTLFVEDGGVLEKAAVFLQENAIPKSTFAEWRSKGIENEKVSERVGRKVVFCGGKANH